MTDEAADGRTADTALSEADQRTAVRERYARVATESESCCGTESEPCCETSGLGAESPRERSAKLGYTETDFETVPEGANLGLGCGNPTAVAGLSEGDAVLDLGSGAGFDCFLAAEAVGQEGRVVGVDMTPEMVERARENAESNDAGNVEFRLGEIEHLPVSDESVDVVVSNCVVNLSPDKPQVFREAYRVLRPGGRLAVSDVVLTTDLPADLREDPTSIAACVGGASTDSALEATLTDVGFTDVSVEPRAESAEFVRDWDPERDQSDYLVAATIEGEKPARESRPVEHRQ
jgi:SAM-dependent methyltransferase